MSLRTNYDEVRTAKSMDDVGREAFIPEHYHFSDEENMKDYIAHNPMCQLTTYCSGQLLSTALPLIACADGSGSYLGHMARRNKQTQAIEAGVDALAVFAGPEAYISPRWFEQRKTVPTWNYQSIQLRGRLHLINDAPGLERVMSNTASHMEALLAKTSDHQPWSIPEVDATLYQGLLHGIVAFRFEITSIEGIRRLNQDKDIRDVKAIMAGLKNTSQRQSNDVLALMSQQFEAYL